METPYEVTVRLMLKITTQTDGAVTIFELEGKLTGLWVQELANCWQPAVAANRQVRVVLKAVTFIDGAGRKLLAEMHRRGTALVGGGCMTKAVIEEIVRGENR
jgi:hypothetical protein